MSLFAHGHPFFRGFPFENRSFNSEIAPLFRLLDDYTSAASRALDSFPAQQRPQSWTPKFDVREVENAYELRGELPGVDSQNIEVEFTDAQTLIIKGRTESERHEGQAPAEAAATEADTTMTKAIAPEAADSDAASESSYHKATVEDEAGGAQASSAGAPTPATTVAETNEVQMAAPEKQQEEPKSRYWVSERSTGSFQRVFNFPVRVNQDEVKASLKNGILNVLVPKAQIEGARRIAVE